MKPLSINFEPCISEQTKSSQSLSFAENSLEVYSLGILQALVAASHDFDLLARQLKEGKTFSEAFSILDGMDQDKLEQAMGPWVIRDLLALSEENNPRIYFENILHFGIRLKGQHEFEKAAAVFDLLVHGYSAGFLAAPESIRSRAEEEWNALIGKGNVGKRAEVLLSRIVQDSLDYRQGFSMLAATAVGGFAGMRFVAAAEEFWYGKGLAGLLSTGAVSLAAELPTFVLSNRMLRVSEREDSKSVLEDFKSAGINLITLKTFGFTSQHLFPNYFAMPQAFTFMGMLLAHGLERKFGNGPIVSDETLFADTLATYVSMGLGIYLGHELLGTRFAKFQRAMEGRARLQVEEVKGRFLDFFNSKILMSASEEGHSGQFFMVGKSDSGGGRKDSGRVVRKNSQQVQNEATEVLKILKHTSNPQAMVRALRRIPELVRDANPQQQIELLKSVVKGADSRHLKVQLAAIRYYQRAPWKFIPSEILFHVMDFTAELDLKLKNAATQKALEFLISGKELRPSKSSEKVSVQRASSRHKESFPLVFFNPDEIEPLLREQHYLADLKIGEAITIGRGTGPFVIPNYNRAISRKHVTLIRKPEGLYVIDGGDPHLEENMRSLHGVTVNDFPLESYPLPAKLAVPQFDYKVRERMQLMSLERQERSKGEPPRKLLIHPGDKVSLGNGVWLKIDEQGYQTEMPPPDPLLAALPVEGALRPARVPDFGSDFSIPGTDLGLSERASSALAEYEKKVDKPIAQFLPDLLLHVPSEPDFHRHLLVLANRNHGISLRFRPIANGVGEEVFSTGEILRIGRQSLHLKGVMGKENIPVSLRILTHGFQNEPSLLRSFEYERTALEFFSKHALGGVSFYGEGSLEINPRHALDLGMHEQLEVPFLISNPSSGRIIQDFATELQGLTLAQQQEVATLVMRDMAVITKAGFTMEDPKFMLGDGIQFPRVQWFDFEWILPGPRRKDHLSWVESYHKTLDHLKIPEKMWIREPWKALRHKG